MSEVLFYHLERGGLDSVLPGLLEKTLERGWRAVVRAGSKERVEAIDRHLWTYRDESFLPHGAGDPEAPDAGAQPVWLTDGADAPNAPQLLFLVDGAEARIEEVGQYQRCVLIFDGRNDEALAAARQFWKAADASGHAATYWRQSAEGRWEKQR